MGLGGGRRRLRKLLSSQYERGGARPRRRPGRARARAPTRCSRRWAARRRRRRRRTCSWYCRLLQLLERRSDPTSARAACRFEGARAGGEGAARTRTSREQAGALYNLAAARARAALPPLANVEAIKAAAHRFQLAAGAIALVEEMNREAALEGAGCTSDPGAGARGLRASRSRRRRRASARRPSSMAWRAAADEALAGAADDFARLRRRLRRAAAGRTSRRSSRGARRRRTRARRSTRRKRGGSPRGGG